MRAISPPSVDQLDAASSSLPSVLSSFSSPSLPAMHLLVTRSHEANNGLPQTHHASANKVVENHYTNKNVAIPPIGFYDTISPVKTISRLQESKAKNSIGMYDDDATHHYATSETAIVQAPPTQNKRHEKRPAAMTTKSTVAAPPKKRKYKYRKATHTIRKEETEELLKEMARLQTEMDNLRKRTLASQRSVDPCYATRISILDTIQSRQRRLTNVQAMLSEYAQTLQTTTPIQSYIHLTKDEASRRRFLLALKHEKLRISREFLDQRCNGLDMKKSFMETQSYENSNGDFCSTHLKIMQLAGVQSVKQVFDLLLSHFSNLEISLSERLGTITIREDDDIHDQGITQNRFVMTTAHGQLVESNAVHFSSYTQHDEVVGGEYGQITVNFVDEDELYPYRPDRIRKDVNCTIRLTSFVRTVKSQHNVETEELVVAFFRWSHWRFHRPTFPISAAAWQDLQTQKDQFWDATYRFLMEQLYGTVE